MNCPRCRQDIDMGHSGCRDPQCPMDQLEQSPVYGGSTDVDDVIAFELWWVKTGHSVTSPGMRLVARTIFVAGWKAGNDYAFAGVDP